MIEALKQKLTDEAEKLRLVLLDELPVAAECEQRDARQHRIVRGLEIPSNQGHILGRAATAEQMDQRVRVCVSVTALQRGSGSIQLGLGGETILCFFQ